jgi:hypothetical protein
MYLVQFGLYRIHNIVVGRIKLDTTFPTRLLVQTQRHDVKRLQTLRETFEMGRGSGAEVGCTFHMQ